MPPHAEPPQGLSVRTAGPGDVPAIEDLYRRVSPTTFADRFLSPRSERLLPLLAALDPARGDVALVAALPDAPGVLVGEARYVPTGDGNAEFALVVHDDLQGRGVGARLLDALLHAAAERGYRTLGAAVAGGNDRLLRLADRFGWVLVEALDDETGLIELSTVGGMPAWPRDGRRRVLVESPHWYDTPAMVSLRAAGVALRRCPGPGPATTCPLVTDGGCRPAEGADEIVHLLPAGSPACAAVRTAHERRWPQRLRDPA